MSKKYTMIIGIVLLSIVTCHGSTHDLKIAELAYLHKDYAKSISIYNRLLETTTNDPKVLYNLGNAYYQTHALGKALYVYKKAQKLTPRDRDIAHNMSLINDNKLDSFPKKNRLLFTTWTDMISINEFIAWILFLTTSCTIIWVTWVLNKKEDLLKSLLFLSLGLWGLSTSFFVLKINQSWQHTGLIISKKVPVKQGPLETLPTLFYLHDGTEFQITQETESWAEIKLSNNFSGWLHKDVFWRL